MDGVYPVLMGDRGRLVVPADVRLRRRLDEGTPPILLETAAGLVLLTRDQVRARVRDELNGTDLVAQLLADRFCLALAARLSAPAWTADTAWGAEEPVRQIR